MNNLVTGYIKSEFDAYETYDHFEASLIILIARFLGYIFIIFDVYPSECESFFSENGTVFKRSPGDDEHSFTFGCSYGWNKGIHKVSIQTKNSTYHGDAFGITTNIEYFRTCKEWYGNSGPAYSGNTQFYTLYSDNLNSLNDNNNETQYAILKYDSRTINDKISIVFNADEWTVAWFMNDEQIGKPFKVIPDKTYHLFVSSNQSINNHDGRAEYQLIVDNS